MDGLINVASVFHIYIVQSDKRFVVSFKINTLLEDVCSDLIVRMNVLYSGVHIIGTQVCMRDQNKNCTL